MKEQLVKRSSTLFLQAAVIGIVAVVLVLCTFALPAIWRAAPIENPSSAQAVHLILSLMYTSTVPFFVGIVQVMKLLRYVDQNKAFSELSVKALKAIKYCAYVVSAVYAIGVPFFYVWADNDDAPGLVIVGMITSLAPLAVGVFAAVLQRLLGEALVLKKEQELTV